MRTHTHISTKDAGAKDEGKQSSKTFFQPRLAVNQPGDIYEQEADAMADKVMTMRAHDDGQHFFNSPGINVQRKCQQCEEEDKHAQRKESDSKEVPTESESYIQSLDGKGQPLSTAEKGFFEPRFGHDLSGVRLHTDGVASQSANSINALAYTQGNNIVFGAGQYQPGSDTGKKLMAHELTHVLQQQGGVSPKLIQRETPKTAKVNENVTETISNAPASAPGYNATITWTANFDVVLDPASKHAIIVMRLFTTASDSLKDGWKNIIEDRWGKGKFAVEAWNMCPPTVYPIDVNIQWVDDASKAHYTITPSEPGQTQNGRAGTGGTTGMKHWGTADASDVPHEFGHMLGNVEEYFTTNGVDYTYGGTKSGFRDRGGGIMNNPSEAPFPRHYDMMKSAFIKMMNLPADKTRVVDSGVLNPPMIKCDSFPSMPSNMG